MSRLEQLIQELCPEGVVFFPLWKLTIWDKKFNSVDRKKQQKIINYPYLLAADLFALQQEQGNVFLLSTGEQTGWTTESLAGNYLCEGEVVTLPWGKSRPVKEVIKYYKGKFVTADNRIATSADTNILSNKFLYYWLMSQSKIIDGFYRGSGLKHPSMKDVLDMRLPVPPLPVQTEIVRILDNFTELTAELTEQLTAELTARKKQYEYYRDMLLNFDVRGGGQTEVQWRTLGEIAKFTYGFTDKAKNIGNTRFIRITDIDESGCLRSSDAKYIDLAEESKKYLLKEGDLLLARTGATYGKTLYIPDNQPSVYASFLIKIQLDNNIISNRFYWHFSKSSLYWKQAEKYVSKGGQQQFNTGAAGKILVPIPSLVVQQRIVNVLDNFDAICSDLNIGLPAEIEARQKQYEYYRDKLLTFKERK